MGFLGLSFFEQKEVSDLVPIFPGAFKTAQADWAKFKEAVKANAVSDQDKKTVLEWYREFPRLWDTVRPNWVEPNPVTKLLSANKIKFADEVDAWVKTLKGDRLYTSGLAVVPFIIVAGILVAAVVGVAGAVWAVGYLKKQKNISRLIDETVAGRIPASVLDTAIKEEQSGGFLAGAGNLVQWVVLGGLAFLVLPMILPKRKNA